MPTLDPTTLAGKRLWLRAKDNTGSTTASWVDQSGNGNNGTPNVAVAVTAGATPSGGKAITFTGGSLFDFVAPVPALLFSASSVFNGDPGFGARLAFDTNDSTTWASSTLPAWVRASNVSDTTPVTQYTITPSASNRPTSWTFEGSNNGTTWVALDTRTSYSWASSAAQTFTFSNATAYTSYRLNVTAATAAIVQIARLDFPVVDLQPPSEMEIWAVVKAASGSNGGLWTWRASTNGVYSNASVGEDFGSSTTETFTPTMSLSTNWRLYRVVVTATEWKAYLDGVLQKSVTKAGPATISSGRIGADQDTFWTGSVAEVFFRNRASTTSEVAWLTDYFNTEHGLTVAGGFPPASLASGSAAGAFTFAGSATGKKVAAGLAAGAFVFAGAAAGARTPKAAAAGAFSFAGSAAGSAPVLGPAEGSASGAFTFAGSAVGSKPQRGSAAGGFAFSGAAVGSAPVVLPNTGTAAGTFTFTGTAVGARASRATAAGSFVWAGAAAGTNSAIPVGSAAGGFSWIGLASGANGTTTIPTDPTDIPFGTEDGELDALPALDPTPPGMVQRPLMRRSVIVPRLKDIPGVIIDPETSQPRIPAAVYATFPVVEEEVGVPHVIFPGRDGVHDMTYYRRNRSRIVSTRAEEPFGDTSAQVEFPQITSMDDDPDGLTSPHPWTKIRANMEVVWRKSDGTIRRHWAGNVFSRNVGNDGKSPFLRITALGSLRMAGNAINKPLNRQDPLDLGTIIPRTLNGVVSRRYNAVPHVTTGILSKKRGSWSDSALGFVQDCLADAWTLSGNQWTIAKIPGTRRAYEMRLKKTTPSWTITNGAMGVSVDLNKDGAVRNVIYGHGVRDDGGVWRNTFYFDGTDPNDGVRLPLAADPRTQKRILHPSGLGMMDNPDYDENIPAYEDDVDFGQCSVAVGTYSAQQIVDRESIPSLSGRITLRTDPREGSRVFIPAGDKIRVLGYEGRDVVLHIASVEVDYQSYEVTLEVSERSHDALTLAQIRSLQKDARRDPAMRPGNPNRRSRLEQDQTPPFDAESRAGIIAPRTAPGGQWSGQAYPFAGAGRIVKTHFEAGSPFAVAITAKPISAAHLQSLVGNPLTNDNPFEPHLKVLENTYGLVACWGQKGQRMGYSPGREDNGGAFTGNFDEYQTWEYVSGDGVKLWVFVFPQSTTTFSGRCYPGAEL